jgi:hypothetical protein
VVSTQWVQRGLFVEVGTSANLLRAARSGQRNIRTQLNIRRAHFGPVPAARRGTNLIEYNGVEYSVGGCVADRTDNCAPGLYYSRMTQYTFRIRQGSYSSDLPVDLPDDDAAWHEAAAVGGDLIRDACSRLKDGPEWRLEVADESGTIRHLLRLTAESFEQ